MRAERPGRQPASNSTPVEIREASAADAAFVRDLAAESIVHSIPSTRRIDPTVAQHHARESFARLDEWMSRPDSVALIAERGGEQVGYILLDVAETEVTTGERQAFIVDMAVRRSDWGRYVARRLVEAASRVAASRGVPYLVGLISDTNPRALRTATMALGFEIERYQVVRRTDDPVRRQRQAK